MKKIISLILAIVILSFTACTFTKAPDTSEHSVTVETVPTHDNLVALIAKGEIDTAILPEPKATAALMQNSDYEIVLNLSTEWSAVSDYDLAMGCIVVRNDFLAAHEGAVARFLDEYEASVAYIGAPENHDSAAQMIVGAGVLPKLPIANSALTNLYGSIVYRDGETMKNTLTSFYTAIGQAQPDAAFFASPSVSAADDGAVIRIGVMSGPTGMGMAKLMQDTSDQTKYTFTVYSDPSVGTADLASGTIDMLCLPTNTAATLSTKKADYISVIAVNCLGSLYVVAKKDSGISSFADLADKTVYTSVPNSTTLPIFSYLLNKHNIRLNQNDE